MLNTTIYFKVQWMNARVAQIKSFHSVQMKTFKVKINCTRNCSTQFWHCWWHHISNMNRNSVRNYDNNFDFNVFVFFINTLFRSSHYDWHTQFAFHCDFIWWTFFIEHCILFTLQYNVFNTDQINRSSQF